ncbi:hypothetical protein [Bosea sp. (in: a-proteobacteria)]|uniref:hypothetical protein n=1 Tax=Bosea sp. (in: a-proteobacteria) TaxID=1871050 RepID=UPI002732BBC5|nr:hypothetical protein [Bosea sp. (in: a-proteobacteria)]MDP3408207.1 hypothetical protein [Bosea sp. (in: a-proteobacteria)]
MGEDNRSFLQDAADKLAADDRDGCGAPPLWLVAILVMAAALVIWLSPARAHEFYPWECCSDRDCWPTGTGRDAREPDPVAGPGGWRLSDGTIVPYAAARPSPDGRFHVCRSGGSLSGALIVPGGRPPCIWVPPSGT